MITDREAFDQLSRILREHRGYDNAITLDKLAARLDVPRRWLESVIETYLDDFTHPVAAGTRGLFIPTTADEVQAYCSNLADRISAISRRLTTFKRKALIAGFETENGRFTASPRQQSLFG